MLRRIRSMRSMRLPSRRPKGPPFIGENEARRAAGIVWRNCGSRVSSEPQPQLFLRTKEGEGFSMGSDPRRGRPILHATFAYSSSKTPRTTRILSAALSLARRAGYVVESRRVETPNAMRGGASGAVGTSFLFRLPLCRISLRPDAFSAILKESLLDNPVHHRVRHGRRGCGGFAP